jgi:peptidoglycan/LPS O-acetylase OafA/YrhL
VAVLIEVVVMLVLYDCRNIRDLLLFIFAQATIFQFWTPNSLRGYGCGTPNGVLWTICVTVQFYFIVWFLYKLLHGKKVIFWLLAWLLMIVISVIGNGVLQLFAPDVMVKLFAQSFIRYLWLFCIGCFLAEFKEQLLEDVKRFWWVLLFVSGMLFVTDFDIYAGYSLFRCVFLVMGVIGFSYEYPKLNIKKDISYGIYLYHMTVVNAMIACGIVGKAAYIGIVIDVSCVLAWLSAETVGKV